MKKLTPNSLILLIRGSQVQVLTGERKKPCKFTYEAFLCAGLFSKQMTALPISLFLRHWQHNFKSSAFTRFAIGS